MCHFRQMEASNYPSVVALFLHYAIYDTSTTQSVLLFIFKYSTINRFFGGWQSLYFNDFGIGEGSY